jgi:hypothetical protein
MRRALEGLQRNKTEEQRERAIGEQKKRLKSKIKEMLGGEEVDYQSFL